MKNENSSHNQAASMTSVSKVRKRMSVAAALIALRSNACSVTERVAYTFSLTSTLQRIGKICSQNDS
jgi:hypothetical protein